MATSAIFQTIAAWTHGDSGDAGERQGLLGLGEVARVSAALNRASALAGINPLQVPRIVITGGQSAGKSTLMNALLGLDLLPTASEMCTRVPLALEMCPADTGSTGWGEAHFPAMPGAEPLTVPLDDAGATGDGIARVRAEIERRTVLLAGGQSGISGTAISLRVKAPGAIPLACVDTPGMTYVGLTSKGQPADMRRAVSEAVAPLLGAKETIICVVAAARPDLEADSGIAFAREHDASGERTLGVLTKLDLCNDVSAHLEGRSAPELHMGLGYYGVCLRPGAGTDAAEAALRRSPHAATRLGTQAVATALGAALARGLEREAPRLRLDLAEREAVMRSQLEAAGPPVPADPAARMALLQTLVGGLGERFCQLADGRGVAQTCDSRNFGSEIRTTFVDLRNSLQATNPFEDRSVWPDDDILNALRRARGNQLACGVSPVELLEYALCHADKAPLTDAAECGVRAVDACRDVLNDLTAALLRQPSVARFPRLCAALALRMRELLAEYAAAGRDAMKRHIQQEVAYVWLESPAFNDALAACALVSDPEHEDASALRRLLSVYYDDVRASLIRTFPRCVMSELVRPVQSLARERMFAALAETGVADALHESDASADDRDRLAAAMAAVCDARSILSQVG